MKVGAHEYRVIQFLSYCLLERTKRFIYMLEILSRAGINLWRNRLHLPDRCLVVLAELLLGQSIFPGDSGVDQLVEHK